MRKTVSERLGSQRNLTTRADSAAAHPNDERRLLAFELAACIVATALERLRNKGACSTLPCYLLPERCTLTEPQQTPGSDTRHAHRKDRPHLNHTRFTTLGLWSLSLAYFSLGTSSIAVVGMINAMAADLGVSQPDIAGLVTVFALTFALAAPLLQVAAGWARPPQSGSP